MRKNKSNISFSLLALSLFLLFTFTFSSHVFSFHNESAVVSSTISCHKNPTVSTDKKDINPNAFIGEVEEEEVEENETEDHSLVYHLPVIFSFYASFLHSQESSNSLLNNSHLNSSLYSTPVFIKNCTFLI